MTSFGITNGPAPARLTVGIVSAGRVGTAVGAALERAGHVVSACSAVSSASVARAVKRLPDTEILPAADVAARSELLILAVPDDQLADLVRGLAATHAVKPGTLVAHTSGANGIAILTPLTELGALPLAIHPAMTFTGHDEDTARLVVGMLRNHRCRRHRLRDRGSHWSSRSAASPSECARRTARALPRRTGSRQ